MGDVAIIIFSIVAVGILMARHHGLWPPNTSAGGGSAPETSTPIQGLSSSPAPGEPYGEGSRAPSADGSMPDGFAIKGNADSMLYHRTDSRSYAVTVAEVWFDTPERAEAAGFTLAKSHPAS